MKNFSTWMLVMFMGLFWILRIAVAVSYEMGTDIGGITPLNPTMEIVLLFLVLVCMILIVKRKIVGSLIYLLAYGMYFGGDLVTGLNNMFSESINITTSNMGMYLNTFVDLIGIVIPIAILFDLLMDKNRKANPKDKKTDWFYNNKDFDREKDDRADTNNYRTL